jgi:GPH family glycoside/pentoside/hexuronide:cation symporter/glucuronide carrier protein
LPLISLFPTKQEGFHILIIGVTVLVVILSVLGTLGIKERIFPMREEKYKLRNIKEILEARPVLILFLEALFTQIGAGVSSGAKIFFFLYALKRPDLSRWLRLVTFLG